MGITGLWEILGEGEVWSIAEYAARFFEEHRRPLRIAVDEACWRFTNLTPEQVQKIREGEPRANPVEKVILWRILRLLKLNIQLIFVNDGPHRPWKRGKRGGNKLDFELTRLTHQLLDHLKVPHHQAPGEAEAECAKLQSMGIVDAVWSDDGDALMFGCTTLIKQHKVNSERAKDHVRVYQSDLIAEKHDLDADSLVLFAMLAGGDYNVQGLPGCGPKTAALLAKRDVGLANVLRQADARDLPAWREMLRSTLVQHGKSVVSSASFPDHKTLQKYLHPTVSTPEQLHNLRGLKNGWDRRIDQVKLRVILRERFNFATKEFLKHVIPVFLTRSLARATLEQKQENMALGITLKATRQRKNADDTPTKPEAKITFSPIPLVEIDLSSPPPEEDWSNAGKNGTPYDPTQNLECEILRSFLHHGLPDGALETQTKPKERSKRKMEKDTKSMPPSKRVQGEPNSSSGAARTDEGGSPVTGKKEDSTGAQKKRGGPRKNDASSLSKETKPTKNKAKDSCSAFPSSPAPPTFKPPRSFNSEIAASSAPGKDRFQNMEPQSREMTLAKPVPGEIMPADALRQLREASILKQNGSLPASGSFSRQDTSSDGPEIVDLT